MAYKIPFGPETITIQRHTQYSIQATNTQYYRVNQPLTLMHFQDGMTYQVKGSVSTKGNKYISEILNGPPQAVAQPTELPQLQPVGSTAVTPPPMATAPSTPPPFKKDNVEGKVACALGAGVTQYLASVSQNEADFLTKYKSLMPQLIAYHRENGWL